MKGKVFTEGLKHESDYICIYPFHLHMSNTGRWTAEVIFNDHSVKKTNESYDLGLPICLTLFAFIFK